MNDETPTFRNPSYVAEISENSPRATPILFLGGNNVLPEVFDHDSGTNGTFQLFLEGDLGIFEVWMYVKKKRCQLPATSFENNELFISSLIFVFSEKKENGNG